MKREEKRQQTRQLLLDTTQEMIEEKGCGQLTLQDIMERSGLSKGAIYHYVKSKDELLALVLQDRLADTNHKFQQAANLDVKTYEEPMQMILNNLSRISEAKDVTNQILIYLMSKSDLPAISEILQQFHAIALEQSQHWIERGQQAGIIPPSLPADRIAQLFVLISHGVRMRSAFTTDTALFGIPEIADYMKSILQPQHEVRRETYDDTFSGACSVHLAGSNTWFLWGVVFGCLGNVSARWRVLSLFTGRVGALGQASP